LTADANFEYFELIPWFDRIFGINKILSFASHKYSLIRLV